MSNWLFCFIIVWPLIKCQSLLLKNNFQNPESEFSFSFIVPDFKSINIQNPWSFRVGSLSKDGDQGWMNISYLWSSSNFCLESVERGRRSCSVSRFNVTDKQVPGSCLPLMHWPPPLPSHALACNSLHVAPEQVLRTPKNRSHLLLYDADDHHFFVLSLCSAANRLRSLAKLSTIEAP